jgi:hypothetical protein
VSAASERSLPRCVAAGQTKAFANRLNFSAPARNLPSVDH